MGQSELFFGIHGDPSSFPFHSGGSARVFIVSIPGSVILSFLLMDIVRVTPQDRQQGSEAIWLLGSYPQLRESPSI